jgi:hypothetical protein
VTSARSDVVPAEEPGADATEHDGERQEDAASIDVASALASRTIDMNDSVPARVGGIAIHAAADAGSSSAAT